MSLVIPADEAAEVRAYLAGRKQAGFQRIKSLFIERYGPVICDLVKTSVLCPGCEQKTPIWNDEHKCRGGVREFIESLSGQTILQHIEYPLNDDLWALFCDDIIAENISRSNAIKWFANFKSPENYIDVIKSDIAWWIHDNRYDCMIARPPMYVAGVDAD